MHVVIIGNGITGITAARHIRKRSDHRITVISNETDYFYSRTALMYVYMGHMKYEDIKPYEDWFWEKNRIELMRGWVKKVDCEQKSLWFDNDGELSYDQLIIATGSKSNKFGWPGQDLKGVQGLYHFQDLELMEENTRSISRAVIVGGGLIGIEMAEMLLARNIAVTFLVREDSFWNTVLPGEESEIVNRHIREHHVDLRLSTELQEILSDENGRVKSVVTKSGEEIPCQFVGLTVGVHPNIEFLNNSGIKTDKGVLVNEYLETNIKDVYAAGDCAQFIHPIAGRKSIEQVWYTGKIQAEALAKTICGKRTAYAPGVWFNSAKFFDMEYQTYGNVPAEISPEQKTIYWEHPGGKKSIRVVYSAKDSHVSGFNVMGIRYRQNICDQWIREKAPVETVLENLGAANFDPEFFGQHEAEVVASYNKETGKNISLQTKRGLKGLMNLLKATA